MTPDVDHALASGIKLLVLDVDGVLTDARLVLGPDGEEYKQFSARDGMGIKLAQEAGIKVAFLSARSMRSLTSLELSVSAAAQTESAARIIIKMFFRIVSSSS